MTSIDRVIQKNPNPFDTETFWSGNFWQEKQDPSLTVDSIHTEAIAQIQEILAGVAADNRTRTLILEGETGSGKTYLLGRLRRLLNDRAFFVYIEPFTASDYIWRHILRYTVDSLLETPEGASESQLIMWLRGLSAFKQRSFLDWFRDERQTFVRKISETYPSGIYNANEFFGVLYELTNPKLAYLACEWLRGDDLDEESLKALRVQSAIETEDAAQKILANFGRISVETKPIVLCFDQLDNVARLPDGNIDLPTLFQVNSIIHHQKLKNFLVVISIITDTWRQNANRLPATDRDRIDRTISLRQINLTQAEALWMSRLEPLHQQAHPRPPLLYPLNREVLEEKFPGGKTKPRNTLMLGRQLYQDIKLDLLKNNVFQQGGARPQLKDSSDPLAAFKMVWLKKFRQTQERITRIRQLSSPELIQMLAEALSALQAGEIKSRLLPSRTYASYSISFRPNNGNRWIGVAWSEDPNLVKFCNLLKACQETLDRELCQTLYLIRGENIGTPGNVGYKLHQELFAGEQHHHLIPDLSSVQTLATYHSLVNDAYSGELVVGDRTPDLSELENLVRNANILSECTLLQDLGVVRSSSPKPATPSPSHSETEAEPANEPVSLEDFLWNRLLNQQCIARQQVVKEAVSQFPQVTAEQTNEVLGSMCQQNGKIKILDPQAKLEEQLIYVVKN